MYRLLVIESKITNICLCRTGLDTLAESEISDQKDGDKEEEGEKPQQGNYHLYLLCSFIGAGGGGWYFAPCV